MGYYRAGWDVFGVDTEPQANYPFWFQRGDALTFPLDGFDAVHASPPCQGYSAMSTCRPGLADTYPKLIGPLRDRFVAAGIPYVIENAPMAEKHMVNPVVLCGQMFGLELYRHRLFESSVPLVTPEHPEHVIPASKAGHWTPGTIMSVAGHVAPIAKAREVMGIDWTTREELAEAIPPAYTEYVGKQLLAAVQKAEAA
jgi:DNA (cytosine-5)-methyltransferase 1